MANQEHLDLLKQGSTVWNAWREQHKEVSPDLRGADLSNTDLSNADLYNADLSENDLYVPRGLGGTLILRAYLKTNLTGANLHGANLTGANLHGANLTGANLHGADLTGANLTRAELSEATILETIFLDVDLSAISGLTTARHLGPSYIGIDTIYRSQGNIPKSFLRDAGVPESLLEPIRSLVGKPIQYFRCFISHSHHDQLFCDRLYADLRSHDVPCWYFPQDATWGNTIYGEIDRNIKLCDKLVVVCSEHALQSPAVLREVERALQREDSEGKNILFPIRLDNFLFKQWEHERKADVVNKIAGDFRGWNTDAHKYDKAFQKFLKALKAQEEPTKS